MKTLVLFRHGKSSWKYAELKDFDRPLKKRGKKESVVMGEVLNDMPFHPDLVVSSPAVRALSTARIVADTIGYDVDKIEEVQEFYLESEARMLESIRGLRDEADTVILFGHNPALTDLANSFTGDTLENIPTAGAYAVRFEVSSWKEVTAGQGTKAWFERPSTHRKKRRNKKQNTEV